MDDSAAKIRKLLRQQAAIASFGSFALRQSDLATVLTEAARACAAGLDVGFCKVCRYRPAEDDLLIVAGFGWQAGVVGCVVSRADASSPQGRAFASGQPSICNDLRKDAEFELPSFYAAHAIVSTIDVVIKGADAGAEQPYGVLEIDSAAQRNYDQHDIDFVTGFANVLAAAVATAERARVLESALDRMEALVAEKDRLLEQKKVLADELQHRVRNNLQLISSMLSRQLDDPGGEVGQHALKAIARRVATLALVYDHLLGSGMTRITDFGGYLESLCVNLADVQAAPTPGITLRCQSETLMLNLDVVTALGLIVTELVTNSFDHAFPNDIGSITVSARGDADDPEMATLTVSDDGCGFAAQADSKRNGLGLVRRLVKQIRGLVTTQTDRGTVWVVRFPLPPAAEPDALGA